MRCSLIPVSVPTESSKFEEEKKMPTQGTAKAKVKSAPAASRPTTTDPAAPPTIITITNGQPDKAVAYVNIGGTAQFDNHDSVDYRLRLWGGNHDHHAAVDVLLPSVGSVTVMTDPQSKLKDEAPYDLFPTNVTNAGKGGGDGASGGGGKIVIGPGPIPKKAR
jgi:hypothetical protein